METVKISDSISYLPASENPLCADVVVIKGDENNWIYDVGSNDEAMNLINGLSGKKNVVLSHFHQDHIGNLNRITFDSLYCGSFTKKKIGQGTEVTDTIHIEDGIHLEIIPIPSTHSKGAVALRVDEEIAFLGDAIYTEGKNGRQVYNANILKEMIICLEKAEVKSFALSHEDAFVQPKEQVLAGLRKIYEKRVSGESYIFIDD